MIQFECFKGLAVGLSFHTYLSDQQKSVVTRLDSKHYPMRTHTKKIEKTETKRERGNLTHTNLIWTVFSVQILCGSSFGSSPYEHAFMFEVRLSPTALGDSIMGRS